MKVYLVFGIEHYEGSDLLGVYDSREKAEAAAEQAKQTPMYGIYSTIFYDEVVVREKDVQ